MALHAAFRTNLYKGLLRNVRPKTSAAVWVRILTALKNVHDNARDYQPERGNVSTAFTWADTPQGHAFWSAVHRIHMDNFNREQKANAEAVIMGRLANVDDDDLNFFGGPRPVAPRVPPRAPIRPAAGAVGLPPELELPHGEPILGEPAPRVRGMKEEAPLVVF